MRVPIPSVTNTIGGSVRYAASTRPPKSVCPVHLPRRAVALTVPSTPKHFNPLFISGGPAGTGRTDAAANFGLAAPASWLELRLLRRGACERFLPGRRSPGFDAGQATATCGVSPFAEGAGLCTAGSMAFGTFVEHGTHTLRSPGSYRAATAASDATA